VQPESGVGVISLIGRMAISNLTWQFVWRGKTVINLKNEEARVLKIMGRRAFARDAVVAIFQVEDVWRKHQHCRELIIGAGIGWHEAIAVQDVSRLAAGIHEQVFPHSEALLLACWAGNRRPSKTRC
jgi:hypothetical protein